MDVSQSLGSQLRCAAFGMTAFFDAALRAKAPIAILLWPLSWRHPGLAASF
jgi:hypothetical protein